MNVYILDKSFDTVAIIDAYESFIWTERYAEPGDFELYLPKSAQTDILNNLGYYVEIDGSDRTMIIEKYEVKTDAEEGIHVMCSGRSLEIILERRVIKDKKEISKEFSFQDNYAAIIKENIVEPKDEARKIKNFQMIKHYVPSQVTKPKIDKEYRGDTLYSALQAQCSEFHLGFKVTRQHRYNGEDPNVIIYGPPQEGDDDPSAKNYFTLEMYYGTDRSYDQTDNEYVFFSPEFNNLLNTDYIHSIEEYANTIYVIGEKDTLVEYNLEGKDESEFQGVERREVWFSDNETKNETKYTEKLQKSGKDELMKSHREIHSVDGEVDPNNSYRYNVDYFMGDIVTFDDRQGNFDSVRVVEYIWSDSTEGTSAYPTLEVVDDYENVRDYDLP